MGNSSGKESRTPTTSDSRSSSFRQSGRPGTSDHSASSHGTGDRAAFPHSSRSSRRHDVSFFGLGGLTDGSTLEPRRETKQERDIRRAERDRLARLRERERSLKEEGVDGGYLVTLGTYTGPEDFSKQTVRQLMIERRVAPFWRGLNDHSESWTEHQLVAAARGKPIPAPDEIPQEELSSPTTPTSVSSSKPIAVRGQASSYNPSDYSSTFFSFNVSQSNPTSGNAMPAASSPLFRGRSRTLASLTSKNDSEPELVLPEIKLPHQPQINGQPIEAYLYKDVLECPICFLYYPPYLNRTRCCDQPICSECFVQIKRPDPHPPEHLDPNSPPPPDASQQEEEGVLVSEPAACPFCVQTEFGITYEPPPFRRGLAYPNQPTTSSHMSPPRSSPLNGPVFTRRRGQSVSANDATVITTDRVRPDWAKKLADARAHAARRSAAATALHTAAYMMGNNGGDARVPFARRRRHLMAGETTGSSDDGTPRGNEGMPIPNMEMLMAALEGQSSSRGRRQAGSDLPPARFSSRGSRTDELEDLMMMEAIRQSLAAEEDRKKKEEKDAAKEAKKEEKKKAKEQKKADKASKKNPLYSSSSANTSSFLAGPSTPTTSAGATIEEGKGKEKATVVGDTAPALKTLGFSILNEPTSTLNKESDKGSSSEANPQQHLEQSRATLDSAGAEASQNNAAPSAPVPTPKGRLRQLSDASSSSSSFVESTPGSVRNELTGSTSSYNPSPNTSGQHLPFGSQQDAQASASSSTGAPVVGADSTFNFGSLAAMIGIEEGKVDAAGANSAAEHVEPASNAASSTTTVGASSSSPAP